MVDVKEGVVRGAPFRYGVGEILIRAILLSSLRKSNAAPRLDS